jgi:hypothetical protein
VNLEKLARKLKRDLAANPKRAALLGVMLVVAGYFWAPLVSKWLGHSARKESRPGGLVILGDDLPIEERATTKSQPRWDKILAWMEADPRMTSQPLAAEAHPFGRPGPVKVEAAEQPLEEPVVPSPPPIAVDVTPQSVGAVLNGVLVGIRQKQATINGETYRIGENIVFASKEGNGKLEFELLQVHKDGVVLSRGRKIYELQLEQTKLAGRDKIERTGE